MTDYQKRIREELIETLDRDRERALELARDYCLDFCDTRPINDWADDYESPEELVNAVLLGNVENAYSESIRQVSWGKLEEVSEEDLMEEVGLYIEEISDRYLSDDREYEEAGRYDEPGPVDVLNILGRDNGHCSYLIGYLIGRGFLKVKKTVEVLEQLEQLDNRGAFECVIRSHLDIDDLDKFGCFDDETGKIYTYDDAHLWQLVNDFPGMVYSALVYHRDEIVKNCYENNDYFDLDEIGAPSAMCYVLKHLDC